MLELNFILCPLKNDVVFKITIINGFVIYRY